MPLVFERLLRRQPSKRLDELRLRYSYIDAGFSIVEGVIASVILIIAVMGTAAAFNLITSSINGTSNKINKNSAIDKDVAAIKRLPINYTSCVNPAGSVPASGACDVTSKFSSYYFPMSSQASEHNKFLEACRSPNPSTHITTAFKTAIDALPSVGAEVVRQSAIRENGSDPENHNIIVEYKSNGLSIRLIKTSPVVSSWCW